MSEQAHLYAVTAEMEPPTEAPALLTFDELDYVTETSTGLIFAPNTPRDVWGALVTRLIRQHKRIEWAIGDAINFGEKAYGSTYDQWVQETGLAENTLATIAWVSREIEPSRRREDVGWSHHREVAGLDDPAEQDRLLDLAADRGMTRFELREAVRATKGAPTAEQSEAACAADLPWPQLADLLPEWRRRAEASGSWRAYAQALVDTQQEACFARWGDA